MILFGKVDIWLCFVILYFCGYGLGFRVHFLLRFGVRASDLVEHFLGDGGAFDAPEAHLTPAGGAHHIYQSLFGFVLRLNLGAEVLGHLDKAVLGLALEGHGVGEHAVADDVLGDGVAAADTTGARTLPTVPVDGQAF